mgnify:CR=1 FL=1
MENRNLMTAKTMNMKTTPQTTARPMSRIRAVNAWIERYARQAAFLAVELGREGVADFELVNEDGKPVKLSDFKGKIVVLEWFNPGCPYVRKHYGSANMQRLQKDATARNVVWLSINSTRADHPEYKAPPVMASAPAPPSNPRPSDRANGFPRATEGRSSR